MIKICHVALFTFFCVGSALAGRPMNVDDAEDEYWIDGGSFFQEAIGDIYTDREEEFDAKMYRQKNRYRNKKLDSHIRYLTCEIESTTRNKASCHDKAIHEKPSCCITLHKATKLQKEKHKCRKHWKKAKAQHRAYRSWRAQEEEHILAEPTGISPEDNIKKSQAQSPDILCDIRTHHDNKYEKPLIIKHIKPAAMCSRNNMKNINYDTKNSATEINCVILLTSMVCRVKHLRENKK